MKPDAPAEAVAAFMKRSAANAEKQKRYRQRVRERAVVLRGLAVPVEVVNVLVWSGRLHDTERDDRKKLERALLAYLREQARDWIRKWGDRSFPETK